VGVSIFIGGITNRDALRNISLKGMIDQKHRTRKKKQEESDGFNTPASLCTQRVTKMAMRVYTL
jgi:hypothetical protein